MSGTECEGLIGSNQLVLWMHAACKSTFPLTQARGGNDRLHRICTSTRAAGLEFADENRCIS